MLTKYKSNDRVLVTKDGKQYLATITNEYLATPGNYYQVEYENLTKDGEKLVEDVHQDDLSRVYGAN